MNENGEDKGAGEEDIRANFGVTPYQSSLRANSTQHHSLATMIRNAITSLRRAYNMRLAHEACRC